MKEEIKQKIELIKNGQVPQGYKKTKVGVMPEDWEVKKYGQCLKICSGKDQKEVIRDDGKFFILGTGGILGKTNDFLYDKPSVLIGRKGTINKPQYMETPFWTVDTLFYSKLFENVVPKYIFYNFNMVNWFKYNEGTGVPSLNSSTIESIKASIPPLAEQQKIATILTTQDKIIELKQKLIEEKQKQKKYLMQTLFTGKIRLKGFNDKWEKVKLGDILKEINKKTTVLNQYETISSTSKGLFYQKDYFNREIASANNVGYKILKINQLVCSPQNLYLGNINFNNKFEVGMVSPSYKVFEIKNCNKIFVSYIIKLPRMLYEYELASEQGASVVRRNLDINLFYLIKLNLPPLQEQNAIAEVLSKADEEIELLQKDLEQEKEKKKALMQLLLTGIVRV